MDISVIKDKDVQLSFAFCLTIFWNSISHINTITGGSTEYYVLYKVGIALLCFMLLPTIFKRSQTQILWIMIISAIFFSLNMIYIGYIEQYHIDTIIRFYSITLLYIVLLVSIRKHAVLLNMMTCTSYLVGIVLLVVMMLFFKGSVTVELGQGFEEAYSMSMGYAMAIPLNILVLNFFKTNKIILKICSIIFATNMIFFILTFCSRGVLLAPIILTIHMIAGYIYREKKYLSFAVCVLGIAVLLIYHEEIILYLVNLLLEYDVKSRSLLLFLDLSTYSDIHSSGREELLIPVLDEFSQSPFIVRGMHAEYQIIGGYVHNIFVEILYQFGILLGGIAIICILYNIIYTITLEHTSVGLITLVYMYESISQLMVSNSLWISSNFWLWVTLCYIAKKLYMKSK